MYKKEESRILRVALILIGVFAAMFWVYWIIDGYIRYLSGEQMMLFEADVKNLFLSSDGETTSFLENKIPGNFQCFYICGDMESKQNEDYDLKIYVNRENNDELVRTISIPFAQGRFCTKVVINWPNPIGPYYAEFHFTRPIEASLNFEITNP